MNYLAASDNPVLPDMAELIFGTLAFAVVLLIVGWKLVPQIRRTLEERTDAIEGGLKRADDRQKEAEAVLQQYRDQLNEARQEANRMKDKAREEGARIAAEIRERAEADARRIVESAQAQIQAERQQALAQLRAEVGALSVELAGKVVGESLEDEARRHRTVDRFLTELEERTRAQAGEQVT